MENTPAAAAPTPAAPGSAPSPEVATAPISEPAAAVATESPAPQEDPKPTSTSTEPSSSSAAAAATAAAPAEPSPSPAAAAEPQAETEPKQITATSTSLSITVLVQSGVRQNFVLDRGYLERHIVKSPSSKEMLTDPMEMTVAQLKECIWKDWIDDWDQRPASSLFIRLIQFGAYLQDANPLKDCRLSTDSSNVIHMAIKPAEVGDDDGTQRSTKGAFGGPGSGGGTGVARGCRCVIL
ncbi:hypothetical protein BZA05DRAFT_446278 [Tricharina praecox]|uniref:uncharacterized protein n=1 Tax=Tricharina praecox TaxID=43433 RepID=UPI00221E7BCA|nr:uncharacterized protein BZA05DRAFT_446278 [Tricharina praecox]KAI5849213.1 hypothetical protein BZA05DRAFT_446278 [Tricharina praecox]